MYNTYIYEKLLYLFKKFYKENNIYIDSLGFKKSEFRCKSCSSSLKSNENNSIIKELYLNYKINSKTNYEVNGEGSAHPYVDARTDN
jgi:hypothetical protein